MKAYSESPTEPTAESSPVATAAEQQSPSQADALEALRRFTRSRAPLERCELCGVPLAEAHPHLLNRTSRQIACSCDACAILFCGQQGSKFLRVPRRVRRLDKFAFSDLDWEAMMLPINLAFFLRTENDGTVALYPSPAGPIQSLLSLPRWQEQFAGISGLADVEPEVEALLVNRLNREAAYLVAPLDECYRLVGLIRTKWRGLSGGGDVWQAVEDFFSHLEQRAASPTDVRYA